MENLVYIDLFAGAGGVTTGIEDANVNGHKCAKVLVAINHDAKAIASHKRNHPNTKHFTEDIRTIAMDKIIDLVKAERKVNPDMVLCLWASLECTNFSKAKGGKPREADSRTLAYHLYRYAEALLPLGLTYIDIENVREFMAWGPLDENGKPISKDCGIDYMKWVSKMKSFGFDFSYKLLNSADYGAYTARTRFFGQFVRKDSGYTFAWPEPTHAKGGRTGMFGSLEPWKPVREVLDLTDEGKSIFDRDKQLVEKTLERIYAGLVKFVAGGKENFIMKYFSGNPEGKVISTDQPCGTIRTVDGQSFVNVQWINKYLSNNPRTGINNGKSIDQPIDTITTQNRLSLVSAFMMQYYGNGSCNSIDEPANTISTKDRFALLKPVYNWIDMQNGTPGPKSLDDPAGTITGNPKHALIQTQWIDRPFTMGGGKVQSIEQPAGSITTVPKMNFVSAFLMDTQFNNQPRSIDEPMPTIVAARKHHYLMNPQYMNNGGSIENPCFTLIARMDKAPPYIVTTETGAAAILVYETDSPMTVKIKQFMAAYGIIDIKMRMLRVEELKVITGFPVDYYLAGSQADQKKMIGNAVVTTLGKVLSEAKISQRILIEHVA